MGTVITGVSDETLTECLKKDVYKDTGECRGDVDDIKCSIWLNKLGLVCCSGGVNC